MAHVILNKKYLVVFIALVLGILIVPTNSFAKETRIVTSIYRCYNAPFPKGGHNEVVVVKSTAFDQKVSTVDVIIYIHGMKANITEKAYVEKLQMGFRGAYGNSIDTILVAPQFAFMEESNAAGKLEEKNGLQDLIREVFSQERISGMIGRITVVAHSGGYWGATKVISLNPELDIRNTVFLDTLYWRAEDVVDWVRKGKDKRRAVVVASQENDSINAKKHAIETYKYWFDEAPPEMSEQEFFSKSPALTPFTVVNTTTAHEKIPDFLGAYLKRMLSP